MRWWIWAGCLVACGPEELDEGTPSEPLPLDPVSGLEDALAGVETTDVFPFFLGTDVNCSGSDWTVSADLGQGEATRVVAVRWDLDTGDFSGAWELGGNDTRWEALIPAAELGVDCDDAGATNLVLIPINGTVGGEVSGAGDVGGQTGCGYRRCRRPACTTNRWTRPWTPRTGAPWRSTGGRRPRARWPPTGTGGRPRSKTRAGTAART